MKKLIHLTFFVLSLQLYIFTIGCNRNLMKLNTVENMKPENTPLPHSVSIIEIPSPIYKIRPTEAFLGHRLKVALEKEFYSNGYVKGQHLIINFSFLKIDLGDEAARMFYNNVGHGSLALKVQFKNEHNEKIGEITITCILRQEGTDREINAMAKEIYRYARIHFGSSHKKSKKLSN